MGNDETKMLPFRRWMFEIVIMYKGRKILLTTYNSFVAPVNDLGWWTDSAQREQDWYLIESWRQKKIR